MAIIRQRPPRLRSRRQCHRGFHRRSAHRGFAVGRVDEGDAEFKRFARRGQGRAGPVRTDARAGDPHRAEAETVDGEVVERQT